MKKTALDMVAEAKAKVQSLNPRPGCQQEAGKPTESGK